MTLYGRICSLAHEYEVESQNQATAPIECIKSDIAFAELWMRAEESTSMHILSVLVLIAGLGSGADAWHYSTNKEYAF